MHFSGWRQPGGRFYGAFRTLVPQIAIQPVPPARTQKWLM